MIIEDRCYTLVIECIQFDECYVLKAILVFLRIISFAGGNSLYSFSHKMHHHYDR
jgi:hypothetical protein